MPGLTPRHPDDLFDELKGGLDDVFTDRLNETRTWAYGLALLRDGYFWEAHEVLEAVWMACAPNAPERLMLQAVIQRANAALKRKMGLNRAAERLDEHSRNLASEAVGREGGSVMGFDSNLCIKIH